MAKAKCHNCETKCGKNRMLPEVLKRLEEGYRNLNSSNSQSLLKRYLTQSMFDNLKQKKTKYGSSLLDCVQSGYENPDSHIGIYAPDPDAYSLFADLFDPIIEDYHAGFGRDDRHPPTEWGDLSALAPLDPTGAYIISTRIRCARSLDGYPFNPCLSEPQYRDIEQKIAGSLRGLTGDLEGVYVPLTGMTKADQQVLIDDHFLFKEGDRFMQSANACRFWPTGRGIYHNNDKTFIVWTNEEDHMRIISMQPGGDLGEVYGRLAEAVQQIESKLKFSRNDRFGFLTFCPSNLGTTIRASVHIRLPKLALDKARLDEAAAQFSLQVRGTRGEHTEAEDGVYDISNKRRLGMTEYEAVKEMYDGIMKIIEIENSM